MEEQYDIRFNRPEPDSEQIAAHQDFDALMAAFEQDAGEQSAVVVPMRTKRRSYLAYAAAIAALIFAAYPVYRSWSAPNYPDEATYFAARPFLDPPATANAPDLLAEIIVDPSADQNIELAKGQLVFSSAVFQQDRGKAIDKPVELHYRQLDEVADYFMAGLPLQYKEADKNTQLDAAVVLDVHATAAGKPLDIAQGQSVL